MDSLRFGLMWLLVEASQVLESRGLDLVIRPASAVFMRASTGLDDDAQDTDLGLLAGGFGSGFREIEHRTIHSLLVVWNRSRIDVGSLRFRRPPLSLPSKHHLQRWVVPGLQQPQQRQLRGEMRASQCIK
jgi:hypothetical protein